MKKLLPLTLLALTLPAAASAASLNLGSTLTSVNKEMGIASGTIYGRSAIPVLAQSNPSCPFPPCNNPAPCPTSPENPTALLAVLGASGLLLGRLGYGRLRNRRNLSLTAAA